MKWFSKTIINGKISDGRMKEGRPSSRASGDESNLPRERNARFRSFIAILLVVLQRIWSGYVVQITSNYWAIARVVGIKNNDEWNFKDLRGMRRNSKSLKTNTEACTGILIAPLKRPRCSTVAHTLRAWITTERFWQQWEQEEIERSQPLWPTIFENVGSGNNRSHHRGQIQPLRVFGRQLQRSSQ